MGFFQKHFASDSDFMKYMRRDGRWISFLNSLAIAGIAFFLIAMLSYAIGGITSYAFCVTLLVFSILFMIPGFVGLWYLRREKLIKEGKIVPREKLKPAAIQPNIAPPAVDGELASVIPRSQDPFFADIDAPKKSIVEEIKEKEREEKRIAELEQREQKILEEQAQKQAIQDEKDRINNEKMREIQEAKDKARAEKQQQEEARRKEAQMLKDRIRENKQRAAQEKKEKAAEHQRDVEAQKHQLKIEKLQSKAEPKISKAEQEALEEKERAEEEALLAGLQLYRSMAPQNVQSEPPPQS